MSGLYEVITSNGALRGRRSGGLVEFRGVAFARPPVGDLRLAPPAPVPAWEGVRDALANGPISPQTPSRVFASMGAISAPYGEDCLTLNIWAPAERAKPLPVVVWIHGGGFATGSASLDWYDGGRLAAEQAVVVVGVNYRLGALGFLSVPGVVPGNLAMLDLEAALKWVHAEIAAFGGDADQVTLMGQSGGGHAIASFLTMEGVSGLFRRAILQSPPLGINVAEPEAAASFAEAFTRALGLRVDQPDLLARLRAVSVEAILEAQTAAAAELGRMGEGDLRPPFMPVAGPPYGPGAERLAETAGAVAGARGVDLLLGWTKDEANLFLGPLPHIAALRDADLLAALQRIAGGEEIARYLAKPASGRPAGERLMDFVTGRVFREPTLQMARTAAKAGSDVYVYEFGWESPLPRLGACHCIELPFTFGNLEAWRSAPLLQGADADQMERLAKGVMARWGQFIRTGSPGFPPWPTDGEGAVFHLQDQGRSEAA